MRVREVACPKCRCAGAGRPRLHVGQFLSKERTAQALAELFGTPVSEGTVAAMTSRAAEGLGDFLDVVLDRIADAEVAGFDETGRGWLAGRTGCTAPAPARTH